MRTLPFNLLNKLLLSSILIFGLAAGVARASEPPKPDGGHHETTEGKKEAPESEQPSKYIIHHLMDSHDWHFTDIGETSIALHLPWIIYNSEKGVQFFGSTHSLDEDPSYVVSHDNVYYVQGEVTVDHHEVDAHPERYVVDHATHKVYAKAQGVTVIDFSLTKTGLQILLIGILMVVLFTSIAKTYKKRRGMAPKGAQSFFEAVIIFVREDIARPNLHGEHNRFMPYLLTLFFFIWFSNMLGLTPLSSNITGNTSITVMLGFMTFLLIVINAKKDYWMHIFWFPGVPIWMKPLMFVVELMGFLTKPAALAIRLFANISAGHFMVLSLISLIFILGDYGRSPGGAFGIMPLSIAFSLFIFVVEVLVAAVQAFVFTLLTAVFIGQAIESHDHDHGHEAANAHH